MSVLKTLQGFNSGETNASYYRFPAEAWINTWLSFAPDYFTFSIKVNRFITDYMRLKGEKGPTAVEQI